MGSECVLCSGRGSPTGLRSFPTARSSERGAARDGGFRLVAGAGRAEKRVAARHGACLRVLWNAEGSALYSAGEDGEVKCWSKPGHLRSTLVTAAHPVYARSEEHTYERQSQPEPVCRLLLEKKK